MLSLLQKSIALQRMALAANSAQLTQIRCRTHYRTGAFKPMPKVSSFGVLGILGSVTIGLLIGAVISKSVANFLEENDLFVPSDDDDDED